MSHSAHSTHLPADPAAEPHPRVAPRRWALLPLDVLRGFLIGITELVPGVSGSTIAMIVRVYTPLIASANHVVRAAKALARGRGGVFREELGKADWRLAIPLVLGMGAAVLLLAGPIHDLVEAHPLSALGLFFGIVLLGIGAPLQLVSWKGRLRAIHVVLFLAGAAAAFFLTGLATDGDQEDPSYVVVFLAAAVAICALVVPGVSGSFLLLAMGLYAPTLQAVSERDLAYIGVFGLGAVVGLASVVQLLMAALEKAPHIAVAVMAGLMAGSLRALWPWQPGGGPYTGGEISGPVIFMAVGALFVVLTLFVSHRITRASQLSR
ncbi:MULTISPECIES: DUF368 domain-containing protein [Brevibacterium]|uniref:DUF368 domain-containing protein n=1 Tax=Brevibacterium TaxID=1696 RepID=UPI0025BD932F|nr:DUF368 domain-containing protein [Brevibacterium sp.]